MPSAYIARLKREVEAQDTVTPTAQPELQLRFVTWYDGLPEVSRNRLFAMVELEQALSTQGRYLSPVLLGLGWQRRRRWSSSGQYIRYWLPPK